MKTGAQFLPAQFLGENSKPHIIGEEKSDYIYKAASMLEILTPGFSDCKHISR
jgi:hypothetical protein